MQSWENEVSTVDKTNKLVSKISYTVENTENTVFLVRLGSYFAVKVDGYVA
ncbi:hypothetical protein JG688_00012940 [Phytophthora aleatoria]|uniref:Uncharacterized protein n=1 Tax=Phytophthora aleatoria TaxID=2496075 RepID=A0A8J5M4C2_9STRA|nr:hypothetical protein JG688_00012940 [Phytophthora aleatoria]